MTNHATDGLQELGFAPLESSVYVQLLRQGPASGYRVAQALGKPIANIYHAIESLQTKGAVTSVDGGDTRLCRAVDPTELLAALQRAYAGRCASAERALAPLKQSL